jgi:hypothetical protein
VIGGRAVRSQGEILKEFAGKIFTIEDVKQLCMQETGCVLKEGDYRKLVFDMRKDGERERLGGGPITKATRFRIGSRHK